jgi:hypothetical protein
MGKNTTVIVLATKEPSKTFAKRGIWYNYHKVQEGDGTFFIYKVSDEEIHDGEWYLVKINHGDGGRYIKESLAKFNEGEYEEYSRWGAKKVIESNDPMLIADGVQEMSSLCILNIVNSFNRGDLLEVGNNIFDPNIKKTYTIKEILNMLDIAEKASSLPHDNDILISRGFIEQELGLCEMTLNGPINIKDYVRSR